MSKGIFITGTDTGVGKTFVAGLIVKALKKHGVDVGVMKPVETGCRKKKDTLIPEDAVFLKNCAGVNDHLDIINPYRFKEPASPSAAARISCRRIKLPKISDCYKKLASYHDFMVVEGAGGLLVPLNDKETIIDLIKLLRLPIVIVTASKLGAINHTLLTVRCAIDSGIKTLGIIFNNTTSNKKTVLANPAEVRRFTDIDILGEVPFIKTKIN
ncbi:MAG: dethiobiotin synthase [Deltaproteobacteria bacterium]|nr:dethiobiotin synthase [Deltaproteobacteria bacterium]